MHPVTPIEKILIAINLTDASRRAFYVGLEQAAKYDAETFVLHVSEPIRSYDFGKKRYVETKETIERVQEGVTARLDELWEQGGIAAVDRRKVQIIVRGGKAGPEIVETARVRGVDLIVMGIGAGAASEHVLRHAPCSVLAVRERAGS